MRRPRPQAKTHCIHGHALAEHGYVSPKGAKYCRACRRGADRVEGYHDRPLTATQELYLESFDTFLRAQTNRERLQARVEMGERLNYVMGEAGLPLPEETRWEDDIKGPRSA